MHIYFIHIIYIQLTYTSTNNQIALLPEIDKMIDIYLETEIVCENYMEVMTTNLDLISENSITDNLEQSSSTNFENTNIDNNIFDNSESSQILADNFYNNKNEEMFCMDNIDDYVYKYQIYDDNIIDNNFTDLEDNNREYSVSENFYNERNHFEDSNDSEEINSSNMKLLDELISIMPLNEKSGIVKEEFQKEDFFGDYNLDDFSNDFESYKNWINDNYTEIEICDKFDEKEMSCTNILLLERLASIIPEKVEMNEEEELESNNFRADLSQKTQSSDDSENSLSLNKTCTIESDNFTCELKHLNNLKNIINSNSFECTDDKYNSVNEINSNQDDIRENEEIAIKNNIIENDSLLAEDSIENKNKIAHNDPFIISIDRNSTDIDTKNVDNIEKDTCTNKSKVCSRNIINLKKRIKNKKNKIISSQCFHNYARGIAKFIFMNRKNSEHTDESKSKKIKNIMENTKEKTFLNGIQSYNHESEILTSNCDMSNYDNNPSEAVSILVKSDTQNFDSERNISLHSNEQQNKKIEMVDLSSE